MRTMGVRGEEWGGKIEYLGEVRNAGGKFRTDDKKKDRVSKDPAPDFVIWPRMFIDGFFSPKARKANEAASEEEHRPGCGKGGAAVTPTALLSNAS